jgi:hypothetical protein
VRVRALALILAQELAPVGTRVETVTIMGTVRPTLGSIRTALPKHS